MNSCAVDGVLVRSSDESTSSWVHSAQDVWRSLTLLVHPASDNWDTCKPYLCGSIETHAWCIVANSEDHGDTNAKSISVGASLTIEVVWQMYANYEGSVLHTLLGVV